MSNSKCIVVVTLLLFYGMRAPFRLFVAVSVRLYSVCLSVLLFIAFYVLWAFA